MGNRGAKGDSASSASKKPATLTKKDYDFLFQATGSKKAEIDVIFKEFNANNPDGKLDKNEFIRLYDKLRSEPPELLDEISTFVFRTFDKDHNGFITFHEFMVAYSLTTRGDLATKLKYAFDAYDLDGNGYLDQAELNTVLSAMFDMLGADKKSHNIPALVAQVTKDLDLSRDGKVSKDEFVNGLMAQPNLRALFNPFD